MVGFLRLHRFSQVLESVSKAYVWETWGGFKRFSRLTTWPRSAKPAENLTVSQDPYPSGSAAG